MVIAKKGRMGRAITEAQKLKDANRRINALQQREKSLTTALSRGNKGAGRARVPPPMPTTLRRTNTTRAQGNWARGVAAVRGAVGKPSMFNAFAHSASKAVPTTLSSGTSVCQRFRYCAIKHMGKLEPVDSTATGAKTYHGGRNALIFHPYNNVAVYQCDEGGTGTLGGAHPCPIGNFGLFHRISDTSEGSTTKNSQIATADTNIPKEIQIQRFSIRLRNITCLRDLDGGVYVLRLPTLSTLYKTFMRQSDATPPVDEFFVACHGEEAPPSSFAADGVPLGQSHSYIPQSFLKKYVRTHNDTKFYTAAELVSAKQINCHVTDAMAYESWHQLINAVKDPEHTTSESVMGKAVQEALTLATDDSILDVADDADPLVTEHPAKWCDGGWMASCTGTTAKFYGGAPGINNTPGPGAYDGPISATMTPSGMGVVVMIFESTRMQEYEVTCEMTCKARYSSSNILSQQQVTQPTAPVGVLNALRDAEERKGSNLNTLVSEGEATLAKSGIGQKLGQTAMTDAGRALERLALG